MLAPCSLLLALAGVSLAAAQTFANGRCTMVTYGVINDNPHPLPRIILPSGRGDWVVEIQTVCPDEIGVLVTVCDAGVEPEARVLSLSELRVHRRGAGPGAATVDAVKYCVAAGAGRTRE